MITCPLKRSKMTFGMGDAAMESSLLLRQEIHETRPASSSSIHAVKVAPASVTCGTKTYFKHYVHLHIISDPRNSPFFLFPRDSLICGSAHLSLLPSHSKHTHSPAHAHTLPGRGKAPKLLQSSCCPCLRHGLFILLFPPF